MNTYRDFKDYVQHTLITVFRSRMVKAREDVKNYIGKYNGYTHSIYIFGRGSFSYHGSILSDLNKGIFGSYIKFSYDLEDKELEKKLISLDDDIRFCKQEWCFLSNKYGQEEYDFVENLLPKIIRNKYSQNTNIYVLEEADKPHYEKWFKLLQANATLSLLLGAQ